MSEPKTHRHRGQRGRSAKTMEIVEATKEILTEMAPMTVRGVCYQLFNRKLIASMLKPDTGRVSRILTAARENGEIDWDDIVERGRSVRSVPACNNPRELMASAATQYRKDFWSWQPFRIIIVSEKATLEGVIDPVRRRWGVDFLAVSGFNSTTRMYDLAREILEDERQTIILYVGDWDPSGMFMSERDFPARLSEYGAIRYTLTRVALTREDIEAGDLMSFPAEEKKTDPRHKWFSKNYGETCVELDAMDPNVLRSRLEDFIIGYVDADAWERTKLAEEAEKGSIRDILSGMQA